MWNPGSLEQSHSNTQFHRSLSSPRKKIRTLGPLQNLFFFFFGLIKAWLKFQGGGEMANILNMRSGHGFVGRCDCGGSVAVMPCDKEGWVILQPRAEGIKKPPLIWELCWLRRPLSKFLT